MPAAAPEHAPRPRLASWLIAAAVVAAGAIAVFASAWYWLPSLAPEWVVTHSPWTDPVVRAAVAWDSTTNAGPTILANWGERAPGSCDALAPYLASGDHGTRLIVVRALASMTALAHSQAVDLALLPLFADPDAHIRLAAVLAMTDSASGPAIETMRRDPSSEVVQAVELTLDRIRWRSQSRPPLK